VHGNVTASLNLERGSVLLPSLSDSFNRRFSYLRLSVTDRCQFQCNYCLPSGYAKSTDAQPELSLTEIQNGVAALADLGVQKVRLTGGEPLLRGDIVEIVHAVSRVPGIDEVAMTTNGVRFSVLASALREAGLHSVNISVDSLRPERFASICGRSSLSETLSAVELALSLGFKRVKVNAVLLRDINDDELPMYMQWIKDRPIVVRFIELMETADNREFFVKHHLSGADLMQKLSNAGWSPRSRNRLDGPAHEYFAPGYLGSVGVISAYSHGFCQSCNRVRLTSRGELRTCLFGEQTHSLRAWLKAPDQKAALQDEIRRHFLDKAPSHRLAERSYGNVRHLAEMGG